MRDFCPFLLILAGALCGEVGAMMDGTELRAFQECSVPSVRLWCTAGPLKLPFKPVEEHDVTSSFSLYVHVHLFKQWKLQDKYENMCIWTYFQIDFKCLNILDWFYFLKKKMFSSVSMYFKMTSLFNCMNKHCWIFFFQSPPPLATGVQSRPWTRLTSHIFILHRQQITEDDLRLIYPPYRRGKRKILPGKI